MPKYLLTSVETLYLPEEKQLYIPMQLFETFEDLMGFIAASKEALNATAARNMARAVERHSGIENHSIGNIGAFLFNDDTAEILSRAIVEINTDPKTGKRTPVLDQEAKLHMKYSIFELTEKIPPELLAEHTPKPNEQPALPLDEQPNEQPNEQQPVENT